MMLVLPVIAGVYPGHTDLSIWEKCVGGGGCVLPLWPVSAAERCRGSCAIPEPGVKTHSMIRDTWSREKLYLRPVAIKGKPRPHWRQSPIVIPNSSLPLFCHSCLIFRAEYRKSLGRVSSHPLKDNPSSSLWGCTGAGPCTGCVPKVLPPLHTTAPIKWALFSHYGCGVCWHEGSAIHQGLQSVLTVCWLQWININEANFGHFYFVRRIIIFHPCKILPN